MNRWVGKVAVVTGASSGIGAAIVQDLTKAGLITIGLARRVERIEELRKDLPQAVQKNLISHKCDVGNEEEIKSSFKWVEEKYGGVDILINNAGILKSKAIVDEGNSDEINNVIDVNLRAPIFCIREAFKTMKKRDTPGHIIIINSTLGHGVVNFMNFHTSLSAYPSTKFGVRALIEVVRQELLMQKSKIKITSISPGMVKTELSDKAVYDMVPYLHAEDISSAVLYALSTPERVQIHEMVIKPIGEPF